MAVYTPLIADLLQAWIPELEDLDPNRQYIIDGTLAPCWSWHDRPELYSGKHHTTGVNMQVACTLAGHLAWISPPLPGSVHDAKAIKEAYSQTAWRPVKPLVRTHLRKAVNKPQGIRIPHNPQCSKSYWRQRGSSQKVVGDGAGVRTGLVAWGGPSGWQDEGVYATSENPRVLV